MKNRNRVIMGTAIGLAVIATAIDHTRHRVPTAEIKAEQSNIIIEGEENTSPCSLGNNENASPCSMTIDDSSTSPCSLGD